MRAAFPWWNNAVRIQQPTKIYSKFCIRLFVFFIQNSHNNLSSNQRTSGLRYCSEVWCLLQQYNLIWRANVSSWELASISIVRNLQFSANQQPEFIRWSVCARPLPSRPTPPSHRSFMRRQSGQFTSCIYHLTGARVLLVVSASSAYGVLISIEWAPFDIDNCSVVTPESVVTHSSVRSLRRAVIVTRGMFSSPSPGNLPSLGFPPVISSCSAPLRNALAA